ncbi:MAG: ACP S-malonyltransferase [Burkholderiales bacterium]|nr:ACP S-malonyltransferase [Burkholderiales bacterium]MDQ3195881.1 ACP S-malonyltransferase [Pseudomonadota bacterium]
MKLLMVFPGQGSQSLAMMAAYEGSPAIRQTFEEASETLQQDFWKLAQLGPLEALNQTVNTQPLMLVADVAIFQAWRQLGGPAPDLVAGHSLGEYPALVAGGALPLADALRFVRQRADAMQQAVPEGTGAIAAIVGLDDEAVIALCAEAAGDQRVEAANFNCPGQVVVAGHKAAVERALEIAKQRGARRALLLPMSVPSHCSLMQSAAEKLHEVLQALPLRAPSIAVIQNVDARTHASADEIRHALLRQLSHPVRWVETIQEAARQSITHILECGPGKVLTGLNKRIDATLQCASLHDTEALRKAMTMLAQHAETN